MSPKTVSTQWRGEPLKRGRHGLSAAEVAASQRERLLQAMLEQVSTKGYADTSVPAVVSAARVSRSAFYEHFDDKLDCYLALCDRLAEDTTKDLLDLASKLLADPEQISWAEGLRRCVRVYLESWQQRPKHTVAYLVELPTAGTRAAEHRDRSYAVFEDLLVQLGAWARVEQPDLPPLPDWVPRFLVVAVTEHLAREVRAGRLTELDQREDEIVHLIARLIADDTAPSG